MNLPECENNSTKKRKTESNNENISTEAKKKRQERRDHHLVEYIGDVISSQLQMKFLNNVIIKPSSSEWNESEWSEIAKIKPLPKLEGNWDPPQQKERTVFTYFLSIFGINLNSSSDCFSKVQKEMISNIQELLTNFVNCKHDLSSLLLKFKELGLCIEKKRESFMEVYKTKLDLESVDHLTNLMIESRIMSALVPPHRDSTIKTEQELTRQVFGPLFEFTTLFEGCSGSLNSSITPFIFSESEGIIPNFHPDDFTCVQYNSKKLIKIIREDSPEEYKHHTMHKDFILLITEMKQCLALIVRELVRNSEEDWQNQLVVLGVTGELNQCHLYSLLCVPVCKDSIELEYRLTHVGSYPHYDINKRIELVSILISNLCLPNREMVKLGITSTLPNNSSSKNEKRQLFPTHFGYKEDSFKIQYEDGDEEAKVRYCKVNDIECVVKRSCLQEDRMGFLTLNLPVDLYGLDFSISLKGKCLAEMLIDEEEIEARPLLDHIMAILLILERRKYTHNDIKPENIILYDGHWFLIDFETRTHWTDFDEQNKCYLNGKELLVSRWFSTGYRCPERLEFFEFNGTFHKGRVSPQSDVYSLGLVVLEVLYKKNLQNLEFCKEVEKQLNSLKNTCQDVSVLNVLTLMLKKDVNERPKPSDLKEYFNNEPFKQWYLFLKNEHQYMKLFPSSVGDVF